MDKLRVFPPIFEAALFLKEEDEGSKIKLALSNFSLTSVL